MGLPHLHLAHVVKAKVLVVVNIRAGHKGCVTIGSVGHCDSVFLVNFAAERRNVKLAHVTVLIAREQVHVNGVISHSANRIRVHVAFPLGLQLSLFALALLLEDVLLLVVSGFHLFFFGFDISFVLSDLIVVKLKLFGVGEALPHEQLILDFAMARSD